MKLPPTPTPAEALPLAQAVIAADKFPILATTDGNQASARPVSPVKTEGFTVWVASLRSSGKTAEIAAHPQVELCYVNVDHDQVRITGRAESVEDRAERQAIWDANPLLRAYLRSVDNSEFVLYKVVPRRVRYMKEWALEYAEVPFESGSA